jgi:hypothetical protein
MLLSLALNSAIATSAFSGRGIHRTVCESNASLTEKHLQGLLGSLHLKFERFDAVHQIGGCLLALLRDPFARLV